MNKFCISPLRYFFAPSNSSFIITDLTSIMISASEFEDAREIVFGSSLGVRRTPTLCLRNQQNSADAW